MRTSLLRATAAIATLVALGSAPALAFDVTGTVAGVFTNPQPSGGSIVVGGVGTSTFTWGDPGGFGTGPNSLSFSANNPLAADFNTPFTLGTLTYFNGTTLSGTVPNTVDLAATTNLASPVVTSLTNTFTLTLISTTNVPGDPIASADYVNLPSSFTPQTVNIGGMDYTLTLLGFTNVTGDGFLASSNTQFHVEEGLTASADLLAEITSDVSGSISPGVPEPSTWAMMLIGFAGLGYMGFRQRKRIMAA